jgi:hypothetical protein
MQWNHHNPVDSSKIGHIVAAYQLDETWNYRQLTAIFEFMNQVFNLLLVSDNRPGYGIRRRIAQTCTAQRVVPGVGCTRDFDAADATKGGFQIVNC